MVQVIKTFHPGYSIKTFYAAFDYRRIVGSGLQGSYFHDIEWDFITSWTTIGDTRFSHYWKFSDQPDYIAVDLMIGP